MTKPQHVVLIGLMGSGKTTVGRALAGLLGRPLVDNDVTLQHQTGHTAREIAAEAGIEALHDVEADVLREVLEAAEPAVIAASASAPLAPSVHAALDEQFVVYLRDQPDALVARIGVYAHAGHRPFPGGDPRDLLREQYAERDARYRKLSDLTVDRDGRSSDELAEIVSRAVAEQQRHRASPES